MPAIKDIPPNQEEDHHIQEADIPRQRPTTAMGDMEVVATIPTTTIHPMDSTRPRATLPMVPHHPDTTDLPHQARMDLLLRDLTGDPTLDTDPLRPLELMVDHHPTMATPLNTTPTTLPLMEAAHHRTLRHQAATLPRHLSMDRDRPAENRHRRMDISNKSDKA